MKRKLDYLLRSFDVEVIFEDDELLVLNKPSRMLVLPDRYDESKPNLYNLLKEELGKIFVVHRLDKETSGVIVFSKTADTHGRLSRQFEEREITKVYWALVRGVPVSGHGEIDLPLLESNALMKVDRKRGKESSTAYNVLEEFDGFAFLEVKPKTGRTHQIRVHLKEVGLPILADPLYGDGRPFFLSEIKARYIPDGEEKPLLARTALHAASLTIPGMRADEFRKFEAPLPKDMRTVAKYLRKFKSRV